MKNTDKKINDTVENRRVKVHVFEPSNRNVWTVVGTSHEYWVEPDLWFCSCAGYYFSCLSGKYACYHLESLKIAIKQEKYESVKFNDDEYDDFISSLIAEL